MRCRETSRNCLARLRLLVIRSCCNVALAAWSSGVRVATFVSLLARDQVARPPERAREVVEYRKSGLILNHIQGCPLDCAYCIRHTYGLWDARQPHSLSRTLRTSSTASPPTLCARRCEMRPHEPGPALVGPRTSEAGHSMAKHRMVTRRRVPVGTIDLVDLRDGQIHLLTPMRTQRA